MRTLAALYLKALGESFPASTPVTSCCCIYLRFQTAQRICYSLYRKYKIRKKDDRKQERRLTRQRLTEGLQRTSGDLIFKEVDHIRVSAGDSDCSGGENSPKKATSGGFPSDGPNERGDRGGRHTES